jgi:hypothetical protein
MRYAYDTLCTIPVRPLILRRSVVLLLIHTWMAAGYLASYMDRTEKVVRIAVCIQLQVVGYTRHSPIYPFIYGDCIVYF